MICLTFLGVLLNLLIPQNPLNTSSQIQAFCEPSENPIHNLITQIRLWNPPKLSSKHTLLSIHSLAYLNPNHTQIMRKKNQLLKSLKVFT